jgi:hypothetical protein
VLVLNIGKDFFIIWKLFEFLLKMKLYKILRSLVLVSERKETLLIPIVRISLKGNIASHYFHIYFGVEYQTSLVLISFTFV